jgi:hypothetical protein
MAGAAKGQSAARRELEFPALFYGENGVWLEFNYLTCTRAPLNICS